MTPTPLHLAQSAPSGSLPDPLQSGHWVTSVLISLAGVISDSRSFARPAIAPWSIAELAISLSRLLMPRMFLTSSSVLHSANAWRYSLMISTLFLGRVASPVVVAATGAGWPWSCAGGAVGAWVDVWVPPPAPAPSWGFWALRHAARLAAQNTLPPVSALDASASASVTITRLPALEQCSQRIVSLPLFSHSSSSLPVASVIFMYRVAGNSCVRSLLALASWSWSMSRTTVNS